MMCAASSAFLACRAIDAAGGRAGRWVGVEARAPPAQTSCPVDTHVCATAAAAATSRTCFTARQRLRNSAFSAKGFSLASRVASFTHASVPSACSGRGGEGRGRDAGGRQMGGRCGDDGQGDGRPARGRLRGCTRATPQAAAPPPPPPPLSPSALRAESSRPRQQGAPPGCTATEWVRCQAGHGGLPR